MLHVIHTPTLTSIILFSLCAEGDCPVVHANQIDHRAFLSFSFIDNPFIKVSPFKPNRKDATLEVKSLRSFWIAKSTVVTARKINLVGSFVQFYPCLF